MQVTILPTALSIPSSLHPRSEGIHLSGIIRSIAIQSKVLDVDEDWSLISDSREITDPEVVTRICLGLAWEEWYIKSQLPDVIDHPGEMEVDGVYMTPDGEELTQFILDTRVPWTPVVHEVKFTTKSLNTVSGCKPGTAHLFDGVTYDTADKNGPLMSQWMWLAQLKAYCRAKRTRYAVLHVLYMQGDYSKPTRPLPYRYVLAFTQQELDDNWTLLIEHRDYVMGLHEGGGES